MTDQKSRPRKRRPVKKRARSHNWRQRLYTEVEKIIKDQEERVSEYSRQVDYDDAFTSFYDTQRADSLQILQPPYLPGKMYELYEESGILQACVEAYVTNVHGYGYDILPVEGVKGESDNESKKPEQIFLEEIFSQPNAEESFGGLTEKLRRDYEVTGNAYLEVVRDTVGKPSLMFWMDSKRTRLIILDKEPVTVDQTVVRNGKEIKVKVEKKFRKYVMITSGVGVADTAHMRYFKEFGDPRIINALDGKTWTEEEYNNLENAVDKEKNKFIPATEVIHFKYGNGTYGVPRWIGTVLNVMGMYKAEYVNYDLFDSQGIPPLVVGIAGGELSEQSYEDLIRLVMKAKSFKAFHKMLVLEAESTTQSLDGKESVPKMDIQNLAQYRKEDAMFLNYLQDGRETIRKYGFRLSGIFLGELKDHNFASARIARSTAEEQVFVPGILRIDGQYANASGLGHGFKYQYSGKNIFR